jgi:hypothetical protein
MEGLKHGGIFPVFSICKKLEPLEPFPIRRSSKFSAQVLLPEIV